MIILWHATPKHNLDSIGANGLDPDYSLGQLRATWLHRRSQSAALVELVALRHQVESEDVVLIGAAVRRSQIRRFRRCLWYCCDVISPEHLIVPGGWRSDCHESIVLNEDRF